LLISAVTLLYWQSHSHGTTGPDGIRSGTWIIRAAAFTVGRLTVTNDSRAEIFVADEQHKKPIRLTEGLHPDWSPDGDRIVFDAVGDHGGKNEIYVINSDGSGRKQLTIRKGGTGGSAPVWSPDGKKIVFTISQRIGSAAEIYVMDQDGLNLHSVTEGSGPQWSLDGHRLTFNRASKSHEDKSSIWVSGVDGSDAKPITEETSAACCPRWTSDNRIVFASDRDGRWAIFSAKPDASDLHRLVYSIESDFFSPVLSPDDTQLVVVAAQPIGYARPSNLGTAGGSYRKGYAKPTILVIELDSQHSSRRIAEGGQPSIVWTKR
jgi:Tol biopolymer transport system component